MYLLPIRSKFIRASLAAVAISGFVGGSTAAVVNACWTNVESGTSVCPPEPTPTSSASNQTVITTTDTSGGGGGGGGGSTVVASIPQLQAQIEGATSSPVLPAAVQDSPASPPPPPPSGETVASVTVPRSLPHTGGGLPH